MDGLAAARHLENVLLALSPPDQSVTVYVEVQLPDSDDAPLQAVLSSLQVG